MSKQLCPSCGAEMTMVPDALVNDCAGCGHRLLGPQTPATEDLNNLCRVCRHPLAPEHDDFGCHIADCPCTVVGAVNIDAIQAVLPNAAPTEEDFTEGRVKCSRCDEKAHGTINGKPVCDKHADAKENAGEFRWDGPKSGQGPARKAYDAHLDRCPTCAGALDSTKLCPEGVKLYEAMEHEHMNSEVANGTCSATAPCDFKDLNGAPRERCIKCGITTEESKRIGHFPGTAGNQRGDYDTNGQKLNASQFAPGNKVRHRRDPSLKGIVDRLSPHESGQDTVTVNWERSAKLPYGSVSPEDPADLELINAGEAACPICDRKGVTAPHLVIGGKCQSCGHAYPEAGTVPGAGGLSTRDSAPADRRNAASKEAFEAHMTACAACAAEFALEQPDPAKLCADGLALLTAGDLKNTASGINAASSVWRKAAPAERAALAATAALPEGSAAKEWDALTAAEAAQVARTLGFENSVAGPCECGHAYDAHGPEVDGYLPCRSCKCSSFHKNPLKTAENQNAAPKVGDECQRCKERGIQAPHAFRQGQVGPMCEFCGDEAPRENADVAAKGGEEAGKAGGTVTIINDGGETCRFGGGSCAKPRAEGSSYCVDHQGQVEKEVFGEKANASEHDMTEAARALIIGGASPDAAKSLLKQKFPELADDRIAAIISHAYRRIGLDPQYPTNALANGAPGARTKDGKSIDDVARQLTGKAYRELPDDGPAQEEVMRAFEQAGGIAQQAFTNVAADNALSNGFSTSGARAALGASRYGSAR